MIDPTIQSAIIGFLVILLGFFIKKWIYTLETKLDRICTAMQEKLDKTEFREFLEKIDRKCDRKESEISRLFQLMDGKCSEDKFLKHCHTNEGNIILQ